MPELDSQAVDDGLVSEAQQSQCDGPIDEEAAIVRFE